jgi:hypothetical protein
MRTALSLPGLSITDVFRFPILADLAAHIDTRLRPVALTPVSALAHTPAQIAPAAPSALPAAEASGRLDAMARRRAMRSDLLGRTG